MPDKISKDEAGYRTRGIGEKFCEDCDMFREPRSCTLVSGAIDEYATCRFWERRKEEQ